MGDWEIYFVIGNGDRGDLLTIVERLTRYILTKRILEKLARAVDDTMIELLLQYKYLVFTITSDNGNEFVYHKEVSQSLNLIIFADP